MRHFLWRPWGLVVLGAGVALLLGAYGTRLGPVVAPSFDCAKAQTKVEQTICANPDLSVLDATLAKKYQEALQVLSPEGQQILRNGQRSWLAFAAATCGQNQKNQAQECVEKKYKDRIEDMQTAAVQVGPYVFSRVDHFAVRKDRGSSEAYELVTSYPRIDSPASEKANHWNAAWIKRDVLTGGEGCHQQVDFKVKSASDKLIATSSTFWEYCRGAAHGHGGTHNIMHVLQPEVRLLRTEDIFDSKTGWQDYLYLRVMGSLKTSARERQEDLLEFEKSFRGFVYDHGVNDARNWTLSSKGLKIGFEQFFCYACGTEETDISWEDLKPYLAKGAPIP